MAAKEIDRGPRLGMPPGAGAPGNGNQPRVLIVDDNADAANSLGRLLSLLGYQTLVVHDGPSAIREVERFSPGVVLLDLGMPGMDGLQTAEQIRALPAGRDVFLIAVTGWGQERDRQRTEAAGFIAHLTKPVNTDQLESLLKRLLRQPKPA
jgi:CheY-like chemotaxis protein